MPLVTGPKRKRRVALAIGTRPEAIKMAPVHRALARSLELEPVLISTGQHRELLEATLRALELEPGQELDLMRPEQTPNEVSARVFERMPALLHDLDPSAVIVQGDTTSALATALVAYNLRIPVAHVEAGLRTYDHENPFPEEANRQLIDRVATWCFAPTQAAVDNLVAERIPRERVHLTGNTGIDSLLWALQRSSFRLASPTVLLTLHRRESFGVPRQGLPRVAVLDDILLGLRDFLDSAPDARALWPVHPNPSVAAAAERVFPDGARLERVEPMSYVDFVGALSSCRLVLTDSGGIQEEAPTFGKTVLVARERTERPEAASNRVVGRTRSGIAAALARAWAEPVHQGAVPAENPYGDGKAAERVVEALARSLGTGR